MPHTFQLPSNALKNYLNTISTNYPCSLLLLALISFSCQFAKAQETNESIVAEIDYSKVVKAHSQNKTDLEQLESMSNIEIFYWYGCESCYQVEMALQQYLASHPDLSVRRTPLIARPSWRAQANLQSLTTQLSEQTTLPTVASFYEACLQDCQVFSSFEKNKLWLSKAMQLEEFPQLDMNQLWSTEKNYQKRADLFSITQVPTIIINESFKIDANQAKTSARLVKIVDHLLSSARQ